MSSVISIRPVQSVAKIRHSNPSLYARILKAILRDQHEGKSGFAPVHGQRLASRGPKDAA